jgi:hypothetical protein
MVAIHLDRAAAPRANSPAAGRPRRPAAAPVSGGGRRAVLAPSGFG